MIHGVIFDFHETLISADRWFDMELRTVAHEILHRLGVWDGDAEGVSFRRIEDAYARMRVMCSVVGVEYDGCEIVRLALRVLDRQGTIDDERIARAVDAHFEAYLHDVRGKPGLVDAVSALRDRGLRLAVISNALHGGFIRRALATLGVASCFEAVVVSAELGIRKPRREIFDAALAGLNTAPAAAVYVGNDYLRDVMGAKLAGLRSIWIPDATAVDYRDLADVHPDAVVSRLMDVVDVIDGWRR